MNPPCEIQHNVFFLMFQTCILPWFFLSDMVIKNILFQGQLTKSNCLVIIVNDKYCCLRSGNWRMRFDSLSVTVNQTISRHVTVGCSLVKSPQTFNDSTFVEPTPLHLFTLEFPSPQKKQLLFPGQTEWHQFNAGSQEVELQFCDVYSRIGRYQVPLDIYVCGVMSFECLG